MVRTVGAYLRGDVVVLWGEGGRHLIAGDS